MVKKKKATNSKTTEPTETATEAEGSKSAPKKVRGRKKKKTGGGKRTPVVAATSEGEAKVGAEGAPKVVADPKVDDAKCPPKSDPKDPNKAKEGFTPCFGCGWWCPVESRLCHKCGAIVLTGDPVEVVVPEVDATVVVELAVPRAVWELVEKGADLAKISTQDLMLLALERGFGEMGKEPAEPTKNAIEYEDSEDPEYLEVFESVSGRG